MPKMAAQLRIYDLHPDTWQEFARKVNEEIVPIRLDHGFRLDGPWLVEETCQFVWIVHYDGDLSFEEAEERYEADPRWADLSFDPMDYIAGEDHRMLTPQPRPF